LLALKLGNKISPKNFHVGQTNPTYDVMTISPSTAVLPIRLEVAASANLAVYGWADVGRGGEGDGGEGDNEGGDELHVDGVRVVTFGSDCGGVVVFPSDC
jgi:hypothetical protein